MKRSLVELRHQPSSLGNPWVVARDESGQPFDLWQTHSQASGLPLFVQSGLTTPGTRELRAR
jgi:hypothetical protein